jgi:hypothetical protein
LLGCGDAELQAAHHAAEGSDQGSTSAKSKARVHGLTLPFLSASLLPWVRVTVLQVECGHEMLD